MSCNLSMEMLTLYYAVKLFLTQNEKFLVLINGDHEIAFISMHICT